MQQCLHVEPVPPYDISFFFTYANHTKINYFKSEVLNLIFVQVTLLMIELDFKITVIAS